MISRYAMVRNNVVENICLWDGNTETWTPPEGVDVYDVEGIECDIGWILDPATETFSAPVPEEQPAE